MNQKQNYIVNMTQVNIESYTSGFNDPEKAIIYAVDYNINIFSPVTVMNLIVSNTLNLTSKVNVAGITTSEQLMISNPDSTIYLLRSNLKINNIDVFRNITLENQKTTYFIKSLYLQQKGVTLTNMNFQISGFLMLTIDPMSVYAENLYVDFHATMGGFLMRLS